MPIVSPRAQKKAHRLAPIAFYADLERLFETIPFPEMRSAIHRTIWEMTEWQRQGFEVVNGLADGKHNAHGLITLALSVATTTLADRRIGADTKIFLTEHTANASAERAAGGLFMTHPNATQGQAVINHANNATTGRTFGYLLAG